MDRGAADLPGMMEGRVALVTGAGGRIGRTTVEVIAREGGSTVAVDLAAEAAAATARLVSGKSARSAHLRGDVSSPEDAGRVAREAEAAFGLPDVLVNCAGIFPNRPFLEMDLAEWDRVFAVNVRGTMLLSRSLAARWVAEGVAGAIVNLSSIAAFSARPGASHYAASKAAVNMLTHTMATEL